MNLSKLGDLVQTISGVVLVVGVVLAVVQLRQTEALARAQLISDGFNQRIAQAIAAAGESPMRSLAKLCSGTPHLDEEDVLVVHNVFLSRMLAILRARAVNDAAGFDDDAFREEQGSLGLILGSPQGRAWIRSFGLPPSFMERVEMHEAKYPDTCSHPAMKALGRPG